MLSFSYNFSTTKTMQNPQNIHELKNCLHFSERFFDEFFLFHRNTMELNRFISSQTSLLHNQMSKSFSCFNTGKVVYNGK